MAILSYGYRNKEKEKEKEKEKQKENEKNKKEKEKSKREIAKKPCLKSGHGNARDMRLLALERVTIRNASALSGDAA